MYNGNKVKELLSERKLKARDLLDYLGLRENGSINRFTSDDIKASRLEQIADFFGVSIDYFFDRVSGDANFSKDGALATRGGTANYYANNYYTGDPSKGGKASKEKELSEKIKLLELELSTKNALLEDKERIINEKDERIKLMQKLISAYEERG